MSLWRLAFASLFSRALTVGPAARVREVGVLELGVDDATVVACTITGRLVLFQTPWLGPGLETADWSALHEEALAER